MHTRMNQTYTLRKPMTEHQIFEKAVEIIATKFISGVAFTKAKDTKEYLSFKLANYDK